MTPKEALEGIKQAIAEHLHKQTGVSVEKHFEYLQYDTEIEVVTNALNELERLKKVEKLLELYQQQREDRKTNSLSSITLYWDLQRQIDELEKELKESSK